MSRNRDVVVPAAVPQSLTTADTTQLRPGAANETLFLGARPGTVPQRGARFRGGGS